MEESQSCLRVVVKVGTSTLTHDTGKLNLKNMEHLARTLADLEGMGHEMILVSSGAIAIGSTKLGQRERPTELRMKQAAAAVGQCTMMHVYDKLFGEYNRVVAQILLTGEDVDAPVRAEHLHNTFESLLELGVIPVVNENDSVSSAEIETGKCKVLGDNDTLSAMVARVMPELRAVAGGAGTWRGTGGMTTKLNAAELAMKAGVDMVITNGARPEDLYGIVAGEDIGTRFVAQPEILEL